MNPQSRSTVTASVGVDHRAGEDVDREVSEKERRDPDDQPRPQGLPTAGARHSGALARARAAIQDGGVLRHARSPAG